MIQHDYCNLGEEEMAYVSLSQSRAMIRISIPPIPEE